LRGIFYCKASASSGSVRPPPDLIQLKVPRASGNVGSFLLSRFRVLMRLAGISAQIPHSQ